MVARFVNSLEDSNMVGERTRRESPISSSTDKITEELDELRIRRADAFVRTDQVPALVGWLIG